MGPRRGMADCRMVDGKWYHWPRSSDEPTVGPFHDLPSLLKWPGLAAARELSGPPTVDADADANVCTPSAAAIDLRRLQTVVYTVPKMQHRQQRLAPWLDKQGFTNWRFIWGTNEKQYTAEISANYARQTAGLQVPFLFLEDDAWPRAWCPCVVPPPNAQVLQLGGHRHGVPRGAYAAAEAGLDPLWLWDYGYKPYDARWFQVFGCFALHAILFLDDQVLQEVRQLWSSGKYSADGATALNHWRWKWYVAQIPYLWQADGHHFKGTYEYRPLARHTKPVDPAHVRMPPWKANCE